MAAPRVLFAALGLGLALASASACEPPARCEEDLRAQVLDAQVSVDADGQVFDAELATTQVERERGWKHRACDRRALLLLAAPVSEGEPSLAVWGCGLSEAIDAHWIFDGEVTAVETIEPCAEPCEGCPSLGADWPADAVLELGPEFGGDAPLPVGAAISWQ